MKLALVITPVEVAPQAPIPFRGDMVDGIRLAAECGYDGVEIHLPDVTCLEAAGVARALRRHGLGLAAVGSGLAYGLDRVSMTDPDPGVREESVRRVSRMLRLAGDLGHGGAPVIIGVIKGRVSAAGTRESYVDRLKAAMERCLGEAERAGGTLVFEAINRYESDLFNTAESVAVFVSEFGSPRLFTLVDTFHMNIEEPDVPASLRRTASVIGHVHVADSNRLFPGQGHFDFRGALAALAGAGYRGWLSAECVPEPGGAVAEDAGAGAAFLRSLLIEIGA